MSQNNNTLILEIPEELKSQRMDKALTTLVAKDTPWVSRSRIQSLIKQGLVFSNGSPSTDASRIVSAAEKYSVTIPDPEKAEPEAQAIELDIVHEDDDVIVINKPAGLVVHPAPGNRDNTLVNALLAHCKGSLSGIGGVARPGIVHRLDKDTSGLMVVAKNDMAHQKLSAQFADRSLSRTYWALVWGTPTPVSGKINAPIGRSVRDRKKMSITAKGRQAVTSYKVMKNYGAVSLVECKLETGRTHQIRVHMTHIKCPLVGDKTYGSGRNSSKVQDAIQKFHRQALHAKELKFVHPRNGKMQKFTTQIPKDMLDLIAIIEKSTK